MSAPFFSPWRLPPPEETRCERITLVGLASQIIGSAGATWALLDFNDHSPKAEHLGDLGIDYRAALVANLAYSAIASAVFLWAVREAATRRTCC